MDTDISFAEVMLQKGAELLRDGEETGDTTVDVMARLLATIAITDGPVVVHTQQGSAYPELFAEAERLAHENTTGKVAMLAGARQSERAVVFEFEGSGRLSGSRVVAAVLRPEEREDLLESYIAVGRLRNGTVEMTVAPAAVRFDAAALAQTLSMIGPAGRVSPNAAVAALAHSCGVTAMEGHVVDEVPSVLLDLSWHAFCLSSVRARLPGLGERPPTLH